MRLLMILLLTTTAHAQDGWQMLDTTTQQMQQIYNEQQFELVIEAYGGAPSCIECREFQQERIRQLIQQQQMMIQNREMETEPVTGYRWGDE